MVACSGGDLHTPASGIFDTHVTWEDIEHDMQQALKTEATIGPNKTVRNIGDGNVGTINGSIPNFQGFLSRICLIEPDWQNVQAEEDLPKNFIAKLCTAVTMVQVSEKISEEKGLPNFINDEMLVVMEKQFHNNEVHVYHLMDKYKLDKIPRAKIYSARKFTDENPLKGFLLMEFVEDLSQVHIFNVVKPDSLHQALRAIAAFEALTPRLTEEEKGSFTTKPLTEIFGTFFSDHIFDSMGQFLRGFGGERLRDLIEDLIVIMPDFKDTLYVDAMPDHLHMERVLCHGDLWSTNILWRDSNGDKNIAAMIDFQTAHLGNPAGDLSRLFCTNLSGAERVAHTEELLETFYSYLKEELDGLPTPYTLEQLKEAYKRYTPSAGYMVVPMLGSLFEMHLNNMNEKEKVECSEVLEEKMEFLIREVLEMHERNKKIRKEQNL